MQMRNPGQEFGLETIYLIGTTFSIVGGNMYAFYTNLHSLGNPMIKASHWHRRREEAKKGRSLF
jgi:hypothetical protein